MAVRVAHVMGKMVSGGVEAVVMNYHRHMNPQNVVFDFIVDEDSTCIPKKEIEESNGRVIAVPPYQDLGAYLKALKKLFVQEDYRIVHSHINTLSVFPLYAAKSVGVPVRIAHSHSTAGRGELKKNALKYVLRTQANRYPTHRLACSRFAGEWMFGNKEFKIIFNAIELDKFAYNPISREAIRAELGIKDDQFVIGHIGRFTPQKNHFFLMNAFEKVVRERSDSVLLLAGDGELRVSVERWAAEHGITNSVRFLGQRNDANCLYQAFDVFVLPSLYEGLPLSAVEAQYSGLPCLLSDRITSEVEVSEGVNFLSVDGNEDQWAEAILDAASLGHRPVERGRFVRYDVAQTASELEAMYLELALQSRQI